MKLPQDLLDVLGYHIDCYLKFTALGKTGRQELKNLLSDKQETTKVTTRQSISNTHMVSPQTGIFQQKCIFCKQSETKVKKQKQKLIQVAMTLFESKIKEYARALFNEQMMRDLQNEDFVSKEIVYDSVCRVEYQNKFECSLRKPAITPDTVKWHISRDHCDAFEELCVIVDENILENM